MDYLALIDRYYHNNPDLMHVLLTHSRQVCDRALQIVNNHPQWIEQQLIDPLFIEQAAMLHDIGIIYCNAPRIFCTGTHDYIEHGYLGAQLLRSEGYPMHADVAERHTGSGITAEQILREKLPIPLQDYCPRTLSEKLICYADKFYSKSHLHEERPLSKVRAGLWCYGSDAVKRFDDMQVLFEP